jgi:hypothetical protein
MNTSDYLVMREALLMRFYFASRPIKWSSQNHPTACHLVEPLNRVKLTLAGLGVEATDDELSDMAVFLFSAQYPQSTLYMILLRCNYRVCGISPSCYLTWGTPIDYIQGLQSNDN